MGVCEIMLSYLVNKANSFLTANVFFSGFFTQAAGTSGPVPFTGFPPPDDESNFVWLEIFNATGGGTPVIITTSNGIGASSGLVIPDGEKARIHAPQVSDPNQAINGQPWPFGGTSIPVIDNTGSAVPVAVFATWGGVK